MTVAPTIARADATSRRLLRTHYENFWVSSFLVPRSLRPHLARIYAYCRMTDDLGDEGHGDAERELAEWHEDVLRCFDDRATPRDPSLRALAETITLFQLPSQPFLDLIAANLQDQRVHAYGSDAELVGYCRLSAAPVGRLVLRLYGIDDPQLVAWSDDVCIGLQLANFAQDVARDRSKGRTYLLSSEIRELGVSGAIAAMCRRASLLLRSGRLLEARVPFRLRAQLSLYRLGGEAIIAAVARGGYHSDHLRPHVSNAEKTGLLLRGFFQSLTRAADADRARAL